MTPWDDQSDTPAGDPAENTTRAIEVKRRHEGELMSKANVVGVGVGMRTLGGQSTQDIAIVVMVTRKVPRSQLSPDDVVPRVLDGVPVDVQETGQLSAW